MLYDILIIDDDFSGETVLAYSHVWNHTIMPFYFDLCRKNLKVTWTTGEIEDLDKLEQYQLSTIKFIICDLHLLGILEDSRNENIISKIMGILKELNQNFREEKIDVLINSQFIKDHENIYEDLQKAFNEQFKEER